MELHFTADFDSAKAAAEYRRTGLVALDDPMGDSVDSMISEVLEVMGYDDSSMEEEEVEGIIGTIYLLRDSTRVSGAEAMRRLTKAKLLS